MAKIVSLKRPKSDKDDGPVEGGDGVAVYLDHHHLEKMGVGGNLKSGHKVKFSGEGTVERSESRSTPEGERHSATVRLHKNGMDHEGDDGDEGGSLRSELMKQHEKSESKGKEKAEYKKGGKGAY